MKLKDETVKLLRNVRQVPHLKRNLISLGMLDSQGCEYKGKGGVFQIFMDSKEILVGEKVNDLFIIKGVEMIRGNKYCISYKFNRGWPLTQKNVSYKPEGT